MWEAVRELAPWVAVLVVAADKVFMAGKLVGVLNRLATAVDKLADRVNEHEVELAVAKVQITNLEGRQR